MKPILLICFTLYKYLLFSQTDSLYSHDSLINNDLPAIEITAFSLYRLTENSPIQVDYLYSKDINQLNRTSLLTGINSIAGVRMEARSPGSFRLNIRGSSLRSPFGVRNVKIYWNEIPVTDPGGNTYLNQFALNNISEIEVLKGPAGSMYGSGTGGLLLLKSITHAWKPGLKLEYTAGSFGLHKIAATINLGNDLSKSIISFSHLESSGFREHTNMRHENITWVSDLNLNTKQKITASLLFSNIYYQTPGGLTLTEYNTDPKKSRPAVGIFPSAIDAKAAIFQKNFLAGLNHHIQLSKYIKNISSIYGAFALIENATIRNYEIRRESHLGARTNFQWEVIKQDKYDLLLSVGGETQFAFFNTRVADNINGDPGLLQTDDDIRYKNYTFFTQFDLSLSSKSFLVAGISINNTHVKFIRLNELPISEISKNYNNEYAPRISIMHKLNKDLSLGATISKGFSPPTISELLPSTGNISIGLQAESGVNYELNIKKSLLNKSLKIELTGYYFKLDNALVVRKDNNGADYFINAGNTNQLGIETSIKYSKSFLEPNILKAINLNAAYTFTNYKYGEFIKDTSDFKGKSLPGVPGNTLSIIALLDFKYEWFFNLNFYTSSSIFLNDANTVKANSYKLLGFKLGKSIRVKKHLIQIFGGIENALDEVYSLGNDINDARGRYYNVAPGRNYFIGALLEF